MSVEIIAEIGQNHNGDMAVAKDLIAAAKGAGADVAKISGYLMPVRCFERSVTNGSITIARQSSPELGLNY